MIKYFCLIAACLFLSACSVERKMSVDKGTFQTFPPPNLTGNATEIPQKSVTFKGTGEMYAGHNVKMPLHGLRMHMYRTV
ncbi:MAG: hypothetical protein WCR04_00160 [Fibrobacteraceae bacterium]